MGKKHELSCLIYSRKLSQRKIRSVCYPNPQVLVTWLYGKACVLSVTSLCSVGRPWKPQVFEDHLFSGNFLMGWLSRAASFSLCLYVYTGYTPISQHPAHLLRQTSTFPSVLAACFSQDMCGHRTCFPLNEEEQASPLLSNACMAQRAVVDTLVWKSRTKAALLIFYKSLVGLPRSVLSAGASAVGSAAWKDKCLRTTWYLCQACKKGAKFLMCRDVLRKEQGVTVSSELKHD